MTGKPLPQPFRDIVAQVPAQEFRTIFDVGANDGESSRVFAPAFPDATIYAFEPVPATFEKLAAGFADNPGVKPYNLAVGERDGTLRMLINGTSTMNRVVGETVSKATDVQGIRLDTFCREQHIEHIDFLKIDTEGHDFAVLRGCGEFLQNVDFVQCEVSANEYNKFHNSYFDIYKYMSDIGFYVFGIYGQNREGFGGGYPILRRFDVVFINPRLVGTLRNVPVG